MAWIGAIGKTPWMYNTFRSQLSTARLAWIFSSIQRDFVTTQTRDSLSAFSTVIHRQNSPSTSRNPGKYGAASEHDLPRCDRFRSAWTLQRSSFSKYRNLDASVMSRDPKERLPNTICRVTIVLEVPEHCNDWVPRNLDASVVSRDPEAVSHLFPRRFEHAGSCPLRVLACFARGESESCARSSISSVESNGGRPF